MKKLHVFIVISFILCVPVIVVAQDKVVAVKKQETEAAEKKSVKPQTTPASAKTIPPGMDVTKMVKKEFEKSGLTPKDASKVEEKKKTEQEKLAEERIISNNTKSSPTTKELAEKLPDVNPKPADNGGYSKAPAPQTYNETKLYPQNNLPGNKNAATTNNYGETKLYPSQEQYQSLPLKKSHEPDNNLANGKNNNVLNQYDVVKPTTGYSNTPNNANKNITAGYEKADQPLNASNSLPNQNQYGELKLSPRYDVVPPENNKYTAAQPKSAAEIKQEQEKMTQQAANPKSVYGPLPQNQSNGALTKEKQTIEVHTYQSTEGLVKQKEMAETKASKNQSEKTALTKEKELQENKIKESEANKAKEAEEKKVKDAQRKAAEKKVIEERKRSVHN